MLAEQSGPWKGLTADRKLVGGLNYFKLEVTDRRASESEVIFNCHNIE